MAGVASTDLVMGLSGMTHAACRDNILFAHHGRMSFVTVHTGDSSFMLCTFAVNNIYNRLVAFYTVGS
jgi:hypothetical protein